MVWGSDKFKQASLCTLPNSPELVGFPVWLVGAGAVLSCVSVSDSVAIVLSRVLALVSSGALSPSPHVHGCSAGCHPGILCSSLGVSPGAVPSLMLLQGTLPACAHLSSQLLNPDRLQDSDPSALSLDLNPSQGSSWGSGRAHTLGFGFSPLRDHWLPSLVSACVFHIICLFFFLLSFGCTCSIWTLPG